MRLVCKLFVISFLLNLNFACGDKAAPADQDDQNIIAPGKMSDEDRFRSLLTDKCGGSTCHSESSSMAPYADNQETVMKDKSIIIQRVLVEQTMPPSYANQQLDTDDRDFMSGFLQNQ
ncbi:MAG: hypothetical protein CMP10_03875 [Zetaproteobacteria bacterium]|nr:hypothetical protein [Pseudobdellovibrionaceae bacterium]